MIDENNNAGNQLDESKENINIEKEEKNKKKTKILIFLFAGAALLIAVIVSYIVFNNPKAKVFRALNNTSKELASSETFIDKMSGGEDMLLAHKESGGVKENLNINILQSNIGSLSEGETMGINISALVDSKNKKAGGEIATSYDGTNLANFNFYTDNKEFMLNIPQVYDKWIVFDCENIQNQYNNSVFGTYGDKLPQDEISLKLFEDEDTKLATYKEIKEIIIKNYFKEKKDELKNISKNIEVKKLDESKEIEINGEKQKCKGYNVFISKDEVERFLESVYSYVETDKQAEFTLRKFVNNVIDVDTIKDISDKKYSKKEVKDIVKYLRDNFSVDDINMKVYVDNQGRAAGIDLDTKMSTELNKNIGLNLSTEFKGKENIGDEIKFIMSREDAASKVDLDLYIQKENEGTETKNIITGTLSNKDDVIKIDCDMRYDVSNESLNGTMNFESDGDNLLVQYNGNYGYSSSDKKISFNFDKINFQYNIDGTSEFLNMACSYDIEPLNDEVKMPEGDKFDIFKANENEIIQAVFEMDQNLNNFNQVLKF